MVKKVFRIPEKKYIQTLIAGKLNASLLIDDLQSRGIPIPANDLKALYDEMVSSNPEYFKTPDAEVDLEWIESLDLQPLYHHRFKKAYGKSLRGAIEAMQMLEDPRLRKYIHVLCISGIPKDDIELILNAKYDIAYESEGYETFMKFFANYEGWSYTDKQQYINSIADKDFKRLAQGAMSSTRSQIIWELGLGTDPNASFDEMLKDMFTDSYFYFKQQVHYKPDDAQKFAALAIKISDRLESLSDKQKEQENIFADLKIKLVQEDTKSSKVNNVMDIEELDVEIPEQTTKSIKNLEALMNE